jgi:hypothetical protein
MRECERCGRETSERFCGECLEWVANELLMDWVAKREVEVRLDEDSHWKGRLPKRKEGA